MGGRGDQAVEWILGGSPALCTHLLLEMGLWSLNKWVVRVQGYRLLAFAHAYRVLSSNMAPSKPKENGTGC